ncbi:heterokaryon incompatibility protein-domain-containing protein [Lasiosphaeria hispida]|uniref:Heterokaryon incompatibility protein-domain-containing protein n=1 Tax=Lasiosphaeria hispida TaxID=260671 RepID=A0AAJ0MBD6_9PEZI|nr:heterokaryon incompatibility protein-domain-containing protein [Lasiosphaeria hispida]
MSWERRSSNGFAAVFQREVLAGISSGAVSSDSTPSVPNSLLLRKWLQLCEKSHPPCYWPRGKKFWPKRVIFVGNINKLTLIEEQQLGEDYLVLSHCWGGPTEEEKKRFCTTRENYASRLRGFSYDELPKTFQDAVQVTRALHKQYLWIDTLCIIQGSDGDWESEAKTMADIFACAYCTIAASSARGWGEGFLRPQSDTLDIGVQCTPGTPNCTCDFERDVDEGPLMRRAWVLQERVLSRRIIHFTAAHTYYECGDGVQCEQLTKLEPSFWKQYFILDPAFPSRLSTSGFQHTVHFVRYLLKKYSTSGLTVKTDRDVAIHSLIKRMGEVLQTEVRYGIFRCFLCSLLLWKRNENMTLPIPYKDKTIPSWSWMAYSGGVHFISGMQENLLVPRFAELDFTNSATALRVKVRQFCEKCRMGKNGEEHTIVDGIEKVGSLWFDVADQVEFKHCVVVGMGEYDEKEDLQKIYYVLMIREKAGGRKYERLGVGKVEAQYVSTGCEAGTLW